MANYIRENFSPDLDFGTGEWSASAWLKTLYGNTKVNLWTLVGSIPALADLTYAAVTGSDGVSMTGIRFVPTTAAGNHRYSSEVNGATIGGFINLAVVAKAGALTRLSIHTWGAANYTNGAVFDLSSGTILRSQEGPGAETSITPVGNGYYRCYIKSPITSYGTVAFSFGPFNATNTVNFDQDNGAGDGVSEMYFESAQVNFGDSLATGVSLTTAANTVAPIFSRDYSTGSKIEIGINGTGNLVATAYDGTTTRTVTATAAYNTASWLKAEACYTTDGTLSIRVNGQQVAATYGAPLLTLNNANAVLTIGNSYALDAPFPGSIALLKLGATVPTAEQSVWMYEQEKQMFRENAQVCLPDSGAIVDLTYDDATDKWIAVSSTNESEWSGLVRTSVKAVPAGSFSKVTATSGVKLEARTTTNPGVDITIPAYGLREELVKRSESAARLARNLTTFDYVGGFTASTTSGSTSITSVAGLSYPVSHIGAQVTGTGIPTGTVITAVSGTTIYLSKAATATGTAVQISFTDFTLPVGYEAKAVLLDGVVKKEGNTSDFTRLFDGFKETIRLAVTPSYTAKIQIQATRSIT